MAEVWSIMDKYVWHTRVVPSGIVALPLALSGLAWTGLELDVANPTLVIGLVTVILVFIGEHMLRDLFGDLEERLFEEWGGKPSTVLFRFRDPTLDESKKSRWRARAAELADLATPTKAEEVKDPSNADQRYDDLTTFVRARAGESSTSGILKSENIAYGFRRNMLGIRTVGLCTSMVGLASSVVRAWTANVTSEINFAISLAATCLVLFLVWLLLVRSGWVKKAAYRYATQLLYCIDSIPDRK